MKYVNVLVPALAVIISLVESKTIDTLNDFVSFAAKVESQSIAFATPDVPVDPATAGTKHRVPVLATVLALQIVTSLTIIFPAVTVYKVV